MKKFYLLIISAILIMVTACVNNESDNNISVKELPLDFPKSYELYEPLEILEVVEGEDNNHRTIFVSYLSEKDVRQISDFYYSLLDMATDFSVDLWEQEDGARSTLSGVYDGYEFAYYVSEVIGPANNEKALINLFLKNINYIE